MKVEYSSCQPFGNFHELDKSDEFIIVICSAIGRIFGSKIIYRSAYALINEKESVNRKLKRNSKSTKSKLSVYMMGIDSISRLNLIRALPQTYEHLESNEWFELRGYNKIGDNTFPNLMAILNGQNDSIIFQNCNPKKAGGLQKCEFMWNLYDEAGYVTSYAEDESEISTFNYFKYGFANPPTDYYFRPLGIAAEENLEMVEQHGLKICLGQRNYADYIYDYGISFSTKFERSPKFGFFWTNSFSHQDLNMISSMDLKVKGYLEQLEESGILNNSIVFFFSDHGMRFGEIRKYFTGWLEERLPFFFIWLPPSFQKQYPEIVENLRINRDRLTSPYDVHVTLKHILQMSDGYDKKLTSASCQSCQSLFAEVPSNRSCDDAGISKHWCTCTEFEESDKTTKHMKNAVDYAIQELNDQLKEFPKCTQLYFKEIISARKSKKMGTQQDYLISFVVRPSNAELEATIRYEDDKDEFKIVGSVSRLNRYGNQSACINDSNMRKYCFCK
jgi:hypothetical protein